MLDLKLGRGPSFATAVLCKARRSYRFSTGYQSAIILADFKSALALGKPAVLKTLVQELATSLEPS